MEGVKTAEGFHGVYLLNCINKKYKGHTYIGYTVNPARRIKQHNGGTDKGGAHKTSRKKPWEMILIVHGFPNDVIALQFEWAWQNPQRTRRLKAMTAPRTKRSKESKVSYCVRILSELLRVGPWNRLSLSIRWLIQAYEIKFDPLRQPPVHMAIMYGPLKTDTSSKSRGKKTEAIIDDNDDLHESKQCCICYGELKEQEAKVYCPKQDCQMLAHTVCLAKAFLEQRQEEGLFALPLQGTCPCCSCEYLWRDFVKPPEIIQQQADCMGDSEPSWTDTLKQKK